MKNYSGAVCVVPEIARNVVNGHRYTVDTNELCGDSVIGSVERTAG